MPDINLRVQVEGVNELLQGFRRVTTSVREPMQRLQERLLKRLKTYPAPPPHSTYTRTGDLGTAWQVSVDASGTNLFQDRVSAEMHNDMRYAAWVQGDPRDGEPSQAKIHKGRWTTTHQALDAETGPFLQALGDDIERAFG